MASNEKVAGERTVVRNPTTSDPNAGVIVAAGDPLPAGFGLIQNTPNKADAAANYEEVDAADRAGAGARPATTVVSSSQLDPDAQAQQREIADRVAENTAAWGDRQAAELGGEPVDDPGAFDSTPAETPAADDASPSAEPAAMTVAELDAAYGDVDGYPKSGNKAEKVAFAAARAGS